MNLLFLLLTLIQSPRVEHVSVIELNHVHDVCLDRDTNGRYSCSVKHRATYWDFYREYPEGLHIADWIHDSPGHVLSWSGGKPELLARGHRLVRIRGDVFRETFTDVDVEYVDRERFPPQKRQLIQGLRQVTLFRRK